MKGTKRNFSINKLTELARILKVISHPVKLEILEVLESEIELDVTSICEKIGSACEFPMMSHHLSKLKDNGILKSEKKGKQVFYSISDRRLLKIFDCLDNYASSNKLGL